MLKISKLTIILLIFIISKVQSQSDSTQAITTFSGSVGITNNGFSIIPTFSLNAPATNILLSWRKDKWSFEPDIRLVTDLSKGGMLFWLRYRPIEKEKFSLRTGIHPAFSYIHRTVQADGKDQRITEMLRFAAVEVVPSYQIKKNWGVGAVFLKGKGLQSHGPQNTNVLFLNTSFTNIKLGEDFRFNFIPMVFFLFLDGKQGDYFSATGILANKKWPITLQSTINKTFTSNIAGNQDFMWNVLLAYNFRKSYKRVK